MKNALFFGIAVISLLFINEVSAQSIVKDLQVSSEETNIQMADQALKNYLVEIAGPDAYYFKHEITDTKEISLSNQQVNGEPFPDGGYTLQITPVYQLTEEQRAILQELRGNGDADGIAAFRQQNNLPTEVAQYVINFSIRNGKFVSPDNKEGEVNMPTMSSQWHTDHPSLYASVNPIEASLASHLIEDNTDLSSDDQVFTDDVIINGGSLCVGFDCVNGESFGSDTQRLKENNLRIHFDDTSNSASFPNNDWRLTANDQTNGGANYFAIQDATAGTTPFRIEAGAGNNALHVDASGGNVGMGTSTPVVELHVTDGDSPTLRLEQNGSNGWTPQTWDVAGNETNFFVRDVTNGSKLPFKIKPGAPDNSIFIKGDGSIGLGTATPEEALHLKSGDMYIESGQLGIGTEPTKALEVLGDALFNGNVTGLIPGVSNFFSSPGFSPLLVLDGTSGNVGIATATTSHALQVGSDDVVKPTAGDWLGVSDRRLKKDIRDYTDGLEKLMQIRPVFYRFNGKLGLPSDKESVGVIAQEMQKVAPYMIQPLNDQSEEGKKENYLAYDGTALTYMLVNSVQEQQAIIEAQKSEIDALKAEVAELQTLKAEVASLVELVKSQKDEDGEERVGEE